MLRSYLSNAVTGLIPVSIFYGSISLAKKLNPTYEKTVRAGGAIFALIAGVFAKECLKSHLGSIAAGMHAGYLMGNNPDQDMAIALFASNMIGFVASVFDYYRL